MIGLSIALSLLALLLFYITFNWDKVVEIYNKSRR